MESSADPAVDELYAYIPCHSPTTVIKVDLSKREISKKIALTSATLRSIKVHNQRIYASNKFALQTTNTTDETDDFEEISIPEDSISGFRITDDTLFISFGFHGILYCPNGNLPGLNTIPVGSAQCYGSPRFESNVAYQLVTISREAGILLFDPKNHRLVDAIKLPGYQPIGKLTIIGNKAYVKVDDRGMHKQTHKESFWLAIDLVQKTPTPIRLGAFQKPIKLGHLLVFAEYKKGAISILDMNQNDKILSTKKLRGVNSYFKLFISGDRAFVVSAAGVLVIDISSLLR